jgi:hypothetical protein
MRNWLLAILVATLGLLPASAGAAQTSDPAAAPTPVEQSIPADWFFVFKLNTATLPTPDNDSHRACPFGGTVVHGKPFSQSYAAATSQHPQLALGPGLVGTGLDDPVGATFAKIWNGNYFYVVWNDDFYGKPRVKGCGDGCGAPWAHSKGVLAWTATGEGLLLQTSTPSWPGGASKANPRPGGENTLGCISQPNNVMVSQHFFSLRLSASDVGQVLDAMANSSVPTDPTNPVLVNNGGPPTIQAKVAALGHVRHVKTVLTFTLSTGVRLISKPADLAVPPWQLVSAELGGVPLRTATWWHAPKLNSTLASTRIGCWDPTLPAPGPVQIATTGTWNGTTIGLEGIAAGKGNHAKLGVSTSGAHPYAIFGDMNQQGALSGDAKACKSSQNGRGGMFFVVENQVLHDSVASLIEGASGPVD